MANCEKQVEQEAAYPIPISLYNCYRTVRHEKRGIYIYFYTCSQFWMYAYTVGLSLSYLDNTSATAESYAFLCAAPSTTRGHALYFRPQKTEFLSLLGNNEKTKGWNHFS